MASEQMPGQPTSKHDTRGTNPLVYELFVLGELMIGPMYGYHLHAIVTRILGPFRPLSWGTIYPLIRRLEQEGLTISTIERRPQGFPHLERGQPRRMYAITPAGRERFFDLMLSPSEYSRDTPEVFHLKLTKFQFLTGAQRLMVMQWYLGYLQGLHQYYQQAYQEVQRNTGIPQEERPWIVRSVDARLHGLAAELVWMERLVLELSKADDL